MRYTLPDEKTLAKYMYLLSRVLTIARMRAYAADPVLAELIDAVQNVPELLVRWPDVNESWVAADLERVENDHPGWRGLFTGVVREGAPAGWQVRWERR